MAAGHGGRAGPDPGRGPGDAHSVLRRCRGRVRIALSAAIEKVRRATDGGPSSAAWAAAGRCRRAARRCRRSTSERGVDSPCAAACSACSDYRSCVENDAKALALGEGMAGCGPGSPATTSPWWCPPVSGAASSSTAGCSTAPRAMPATSGTWWSSPTVGRARAVAAAVSKPRRPVCPSSRSPVVRLRRRNGNPSPHRYLGRPGGGLGGQSARSGVGRGGGIGGARLRRTVLHCRPG
jgi:hypothetical protein